MTSHLLRKAEMAWGWSERSTEKIDVYNRCIQIYFQRVNSLTSFSGRSAISTIKCDIAKERTANRILSKFQGKIETKNP